MINYDLPASIENYLHRIGRSGRYGRKGVAINMVSKDEYQKMKEIEKHYNTQVRVFILNNFFLDVPEITCHF